MSIPALKRDNPLDLFYRQHVMEVKPAFREVTAGREGQAPDRQNSGALARVLALPAPTVPSKP
ncbi:hypothetical protein [Streptomyces sp. NRRL S-1824]|uniref:hypothetical protein n=1 Tax=Streptomyces sp. NRRL S-1824 TaxID=1463889 RepID=UPI0004C5152D|nr:hypothetical protein [Streptomyces sp. NRRL S-1824]